MWHWARIVVIAIGILLLILGVIRGRELRVVGEVPAEDVGRVVGFTAFPLVTGLGMPAPSSRPWALECIEQWQAAASQAEIAEALGLTE